MRADLGARLVAAGLVTREELADALSVVPPHGGALARELVARGVEEDALAGFFVADGFGPLVDARELSLVDVGASRHFSARMAIDLLAVAVRRSPSGLVVAMADPSDDHVVTELRHVVGGEIVPAVARVRELLATLARLFPKETVELDDVVMPLSRRKSAEPRERRPTADFQRPDAGRPRRTTANFARHPDKPRRDTAQMERASPTPASAQPAVVAFTPDLAAERASEAPATLPPALPPAMADAPRFGRQRKKSLPPSAGNRWSDLATPNPTDTIARRAARARSVLPSRLAHERLPKPAHDKHEGGDLGSVLASLRASRTRDDALRLACEGVLPVCRAAVFLVLQKGILRGRHAFGPGLSKQAIENLWIPTTSRSMFNRVVETGQPYVGPHGSSSADAVFRAAIGSRGAEMVLMPVVLSGRTIAVLAVDEPDDVDVAFERAEVVAQATGDALRRIIVSGKSV